LSPMSPNFMRTHLRMAFLGLAGGHDVVSGKDRTDRTAWDSSFDVERTERTKQRIT
jgi:hypothetical protein